MSANDIQPLPVSIAPALIQIKEILDGKKIIAIEITNGPETWFYDFDQEHFPSMRLGRFPRKSIYEDYQRRLVYQFPPRQEPSDGEVIRNFVSAGDLVSAQRHILKLLMKENGDGNSK